MDTEDSTDNEDNEDKCLVDFDNTVADYSEYNEDTVDNEQKDVDVY